MHEDESGEIIGGWLVKLVVIMAVISLFSYDFLSIAFTWFSLDDAAREVAVAVADGVSDPTQLARASERATEAAATQDVEFIGVEFDGDFVVVEIARRADTLWLHRIAEGITKPSVDGRARWRG